MPLILDPPLPPHEVCPSSNAGDQNEAEPVIEALVNEEGMIAGAELPRWPALFALWTQRRAATKASAWGAAASERYRKLLGNLLRFTRADGSLAFDDLQPAESRASARARRSAVVDVWQAAWPYADAEQRLAIAALFPETAKNAKAAASARKKTAELAEPAAHSEAAALAIMRPTWSPREMLAIDYRGRQMRSELICSGQVLWSGACNPQLSLDGRQLSPISDWEQLCWVSDDDADYLELQLELSEGVRVQRQWLLTREDRFLFAADAIMAERPANIDYRLTLPLVEDVGFSPATETQEGFLTGSNARRQAHLLPLGLNEWRGDAAKGELAMGERGLDLRLAARSARALYAPLFVGLTSRRFSRPVTWRQLTVAENRVIEPSDVAVGYRVQIGREQWLFYRSLGPCGNRTLLGQNLVSEFLAARFGRTGIVETLMEIEDSADE
ncbi:MAG TPA: hypothetical protein VF306_15210 [Pirellulales bacterium]